MKCSILTLFPDAISPYINSSMLKKAQERKLLRVAVFDIRDFALDKHRLTDDIPYGGGPGMVMKASPILRAVEKAVKDAKVSPKETVVILTSPSGKKFTNTSARQYAKKYKHIVIVAGHYEGIDARVEKALRKQGYTLVSISIGDYVLTGGELPALVIVDAVARQIPGVLGDADSLEEGRGGSIPAYTRPEELLWPEKKGKEIVFRVPKVLLSGHHARIAEWRKKHRKKLS